MTLFIWGFVGAVLGLLAGSMAGDGSLTVRIEYVLVGIFGAFIGAEFLASMFTTAAVVPVPAAGAAKTFGPAAVAAPAAFSIGGLALAVLGAGVMLGALAFMRKAVGPLKSGKRKPERRY
jgi:uncharacterized membrane protein YeaQ/YmgE (transglycosylase-associated protein family)